MQGLQKSVREATEDGETKLENLEKLGVPIPNFVKKALASTEEKINEDSKDGDEDKEE